MGKNKYAFLENRLIFQNAPEAKPQDFESELSPQTPEGKFDDLSRQIQETRDSFQDFEKMSENEAIEAYNKLQDLSDKIGMLRNEIDESYDIGIDLKKTLITKLDQLKVYMEDLLDQLYITGKDEYGLNVAMISNLSDFFHHPWNKYPDHIWIDNFKSLNYENQKKVLDRIVGELDSMTAGTPIVGDVEEDFWRNFAAEHEKQEGNPNYDWEEFIKMLISNSRESLKKDLLNDKYLGDDGKPTDEWYRVFSMLNEPEKRALLDKLPTDVKEEVKLEINSI